MLGNTVGPDVGSDEGLAVGRLVGTIVGHAVGRLVGINVGALQGDKAGVNEGLLVRVGAGKVGLEEGRNLVSEVGSPLGAADGRADVIDEIRN
jgi:hypothetical protein